MKQHYDWVIVGAGFTGAVLAQQIATRLGKRVLVIDRRDHIAGNAYDEPHGDLLVHRYGPHIFHTNSKMVFDYLSQFTGWRRYHHRVLGHVDGELVPIPFNLETLDRLFPRFMADRIGQKLIDTYGFGEKVPVLKLRQSSDPEVRFIADFVYDKVFKNYTQKQWGMRPEDLAEHVTARVPVFLSRDSRYFQDIYQAMPAEGYTRMFQRILDHSLITVSLGTEWKDVADSLAFERVVFTGPIDEYFEYAHGALPYRSLRFVFADEGRSSAQPVGTVNYPNEYDFTRITDQRHLDGRLDADPTLIYEYPIAYVPGENEPYYPIPNDQTAQLLAPYRKLADQHADRVLFAGRLGDYAYYNMDQACARALSMFEKTIRPIYEMAQVG
ncbi:MAG: UDP-galactopyranose mutase [Novosphingobium sp.]